ncbi:peptide deformylase [Strigomonas culicis]|nr:peptide deformylase [Strigomonas culicis]|eukprot:EPY35558.1 peptide deformylase [Strigomonas culicis]
MVEAHLDVQHKAMGKVAIYPHRSMTRPVLPINVQDVTSPLFIHRVLELTKLAQDLDCVSFSGPKGHWDASVVFIKSDPNQAEFDVWVNPEIPGYDDRTSAAPMYGMWENCVSCGACHAWVIRPQRVTCTGYDQHGKRKQQVLGGMLARCLMHELDHLSGKTILQQTVGPEFVVSGVAMAQRDLWPANFPSAEAYMTGSHQFFDYVTNTTIVPQGLEFWYAQNTSSQSFQDERLGR